MGRESSDVDKFNLGPFLQVQLRIAKVNSAYICLLLVLEFCNVKPTCWKSWDGMKTAKIQQSAKALESYFKPTQNEIYK